MRIETIAELLAVVKCRGFSRAARQLYTSQSGLSARIASLEKELGFEVLDRSGPHIAPTPAGAAFIEQAHVIVDAYEKGRRDGLAIARRKPPLRLGGVEMGSREFQALLRIDGPAFVFASAGTTVPFYEGLFSGAFDLEIAASPYDPDMATPARDLDGRYTFMRIGTGLGAIAMAKTNPLADKDELTSRDLDGMTVTIGMLTYFDEWRRVIDAMVGPNVHLDYQLKQFDSLAEIARDSLGDTLHICSKASTQAFYRHREDIVIRTCVDGRELTYPLYLGYRTDDTDGCIAQLAENIRLALEEMGHGQ